MNEKAFTNIDDIFSDFMMKKIPRETFEKRLSAALSNLQFVNGKKHFEVAIINENQKAPFFGMYVYPIMDSLDAMAESLVDGISYGELLKKWRYIDNWYIEIDAKCFDRKILNFNPKELTAMIIHELGHVIESDAPVERWYRAYQEAKLRTKLADRSSLKVLYLLYTVPLSLACMQRSWVNNKNQVKLEYNADNEALRCGYGDALVSALDKIIKVSGSINESENAKDHMVANSVEWCNANIVDLTHRKNRLKDDLYYQTLKTNSNFIRALGIRLMTLLGAKTSERYTGYAIEMTAELFNDPEFAQKYTVSLDAAIMTKWCKLIEGAKNGSNIAFANEAFGRKNQPPKLPSQYDIDAIAIEIDKITTHYDRTYVLDLIYKVLDDITIFQEYLEANDPKKLGGYERKIHDMQKELDGLRKQCLAKKNLDRQYRLFVKYPEGYEG